MGRSIDLLLWWIVALILGTLLVLLLPPRVETTLTSTTTDDDLCHPSCDCLDTFFDCKKRGLTTFPDDFPYWVQKLNMSYNEIRNIEGHSLSRLLQLQSLSLDGNNLTDIPSPPAQLQDLIYLSLSRNSISLVEGDQLSSFRSLRELDLSRNRIEFLNNSSFPLNSSLHILNLGANQIESLENGSLDGLVSLQELILTRNRIKSLSKDLFTSTKNLERLDLSRNKLEVMDSLRFQELKKLHLLNLRRNHMTNLSDAAFYGLDKLQQLYLDGNSIRIVEKRWLYGLRSLRMLNLSRNELERMEDNAWEYMEELHTLDLSWNKLTGIGKGSLKGLTRLRNLDLSYNSIVDIQEDSFLTLEQLENFDLSNNGLSWVLEDVAGPFRGLGDCHTLNLASNKIQTLHPKALVGLASLKSLNLTSNPIKWLSPNTFQEFPSLALILNDVHSFVCDCEATWLHSRLTTQPFVAGVAGTGKLGRSRHRDSGPPPRTFNPKKISGTKNTPTCAFPSTLEGKSLTDLSLKQLTCEAENNPSRPVFLVEPKTQTLLMDGNGSLSCHSQSHSNSPISISWRKDHKPLPSHLESRVQNLERMVSNGSVEIVSSLHLLNVTWIDAGSYQCLVQNQLGLVYSPKANVTVHIFPSFVKMPSNVTVRMGSNAKLECGAKGFPAPEIAFQKDGGENVPAALDRRFHVMPNDDSFIIMEVKLIDMGVYCCSARNAAGEIRACASVTVYETPSFSSRMKDERVVEGSNTILECQSSGSPKPQISWSKDNVLVQEGRERYLLKENGSFLIIKDIKPEDAGRFECLLSNAVGTARDFLTLVVIPSGSSSMTHWSSPVMIIALVVVSALCVIATIVAWFVVICRDKRKSSYRGSPASNGTSRRHSRYEDLEDHPPSLTFSAPSYQVTTIHCGDAGSQSSSGKDSGTGDDLPPEVETVGILEPEEEALMRHSWRKPELETFSTFCGPTRVAGARLSQARIELKSDACGDVISLAHPPGREFLTMPRKVPMPVPPPFIVLPPRLSDTLEVLETRSGCPSSSSSSGYSSLGARKPSKLSKERTHSVNSNSDGTDSLNGTACSGLLSGADCSSSTDGLSSANHLGGDSSVGVCSDSESGPGPPGYEDEVVRKLSISSVCLKEPSQSISTPV